MSSMADVISVYLQGLLDENQGQLEVSRKELAEQFDCVPSQITYVLQTRFLPRNGYHVVGIRGGGGYIRISQRRMDAEVAQRIGEKITEKSAHLLIDSLFKQQYLDLKERQMLRTAVSDHTFGFGGEEADVLRSRILRSLLFIVLS